MRFTPTAIAGAVIVEPDMMTDERGGFGRVQCPADFAAAGHPFLPSQASLSPNPRALTLRGMHYQNPPHDETKLVRVARGRIFDVAVDLRPDSPTYLSWTGVELSGDNARAFLIGPGLAHGFLTLEDHTDVYYQIDRMFEPGHGQGVRWNDPAFAIVWPDTPRLMSDRDAGYPDHRVS